ncbi:transmembrane protein, putative [Medicago truncatula]|uniref:Transmembrane protein, putative n=1 Tax=Medicago truncatula TaxID=3880 RepID=G7JRG1_MEDTR|nr:transmembrane protein, putative [Medicago truncatula]
MQIGKAPREDLVRQGMQIQETSEDIRERRNSISSSKTSYKEENTKKKRNKKLTKTRRKQVSTIIEKKFHDELYILLEVLAVESPFLLCCIILQLLGGYYEGDGDVLRMFLGITFFHLKILFFLDSSSYDQSNNDICGYI